MNRPSLRVGRSKSVGEREGKMDPALGSYEEKRELRKSGVEARSTTKRSNAAAAGRFCLHHFAASSSLTVDFIRISHLQRCRDGQRNSTSKLICLGQSKEQRRRRRCSSHCPASFRTKSRQAHQRSSAQLPPASVIQLCRTLYIRSSGGDLLLDTVSRCSIGRLTCFFFRMLRNAYSISRP